MLGIENLKKLIAAGLNFGKSAAAALADKKISFFEAIGLIPEAFALVGVGKTWVEVQAEISELDEAEKLELKQFVSDEFNIPNDKLEVFIENAIQQIVSLNALIIEFKHINDPSSL